MMIQLQQFGCHRPILVQDEKTARVGLQTQFRSL